MKNGNITQHLLVYGIKRDYVQPSRSSHPENSGPVAALTPSGQHPYFVALHVSQSAEPSHSKHPTPPSPAAAVMPSGQHPNLSYQTQNL